MNPPANTGAAEKWRMSGELIATMGTILTVGLAIAGLILTSNSALREDMANSNSALREDVRELRADMAKQREATGELRGAIQSLGERVAKIEGKLEVMLTAAPAAEGG